MADIFISYQPERQPAAQHLANVLELYGYSVWFDRGEGQAGFGGGQVEQELRGARAVIVLWCTMSRENDWVKEQANVAKGLNTLIPTWLEKVNPPMGFTLAETIDLSAWDGSPRSPVLTRLLIEIATKVGRSPQPNYPRLAAYEETWKLFGAPSLAGFALAGGPGQPPMPGMMPSPGAPGQPGAYGAQPGGAYGAQPGGAYGGPPGGGYGPPAGGPGQWPQRGGPQPMPGAAPKARPPWLAPLLAAVGGALLIAVIFGVYVALLPKKGGGSSTSTVAGSSDIPKVMIPAGEFFMGCNASVDSECDDDEKPPRRITLPAYQIHKTEVTVAAFRACVDAGACSSAGLNTDERFAEHCNWGRSGRDDHPINCVSWDDARSFCSWAGMRLPTDPEWEKAARGAEGLKYPWGNTTYGSVLVANVADESAKRVFSGWGVAEGYDDGFVDSAPVGSFPAGGSPYGVYDMVGNVSEWTSDNFDAQNNYYTIRGGSWYNQPGDSRASFRDRDAPSFRGAYVGFRCVQGGGPPISTSRADGGSQFPTEGVQSGQMVPVPGGPFKMGCNPNVEEGCTPPMKSVRVRKFSIDKTEVTVADYRACVEAGRCASDSFQTKNDDNYCNWGHSDRDNHPINCVTWFGAKAYCEYQGKRLPTEAEWEKAARGTDGRIFPWGNTPPLSCDYAIIDDGRTLATAGSETDGCGHDSTWPVGSKPAGVSPYGAFDMLGNVHEWTSDWYQENESRTVRGGSWYYPPDSVGVAIRHRYPPGMFRYNVGFRCVKN